MGRREFSKQTQRLARARSGGKCEAVGTLYGFPTSVRCNRDLVYGVHFDHVDCEAVSKDNSLENCAAVCPPCNMRKAHTVDAPRAAKTKRQADKANGIRGPKRPWPSRPMSGRYVANVKQLEDL